MQPLPSPPVGGDRWDIRATPLGDALYESHVLDYDLVRQVREGGRDQETD